jgi:hypothetical protein
MIAHTNPEINRYLTLSAISSVCNIFLFDSRDWSFGTSEVDVDVVALLTEVEDGVVDVIVLEVEEDGVVDVIVLEVEEDGISEVLFNSLLIVETTNNKVLNPMKNPIATIIRKKLMD